MRKFRILKDVVLAFLTPQDQYDSLFKPGDPVELGFGPSRANPFGGEGIWVMRTDVTRQTESITSNHMIDVWLRDGTIEEITA